MKIIVYQSFINNIGGVESFTYNMCKRLSKHYEILLLYVACDINQLIRLNNYVDVEKYDKTKEYECDICILASSWGGYPETVKAKRYIQMIHADYEVLYKTGWKYNKFHKTTEHYAVSNHVRDTFNKFYNEKATTVYNILDEIKETKHILKLVSATRLSQEKGYDRMVILANKLKEKGIKFRWTIFTDLDRYKVKPMEYEEIVFMKPTYDIFDYIKEADYGVQLSDTEGYSYFVNECLQYGTAMITTNFKSAYESVIDEVNGYILPFELFKSNEWDKVIDKIVNKIPNNFKYEEKSNEDTWIKLLGKPSKVKPRTPKQLTMKVKTKKYYDIELKRIVDNEEIIMQIDRAMYLIDKKLVVEIK